MPRRRKRKLADYKPPRPAPSSDPRPQASGQRAARPPDREAARQLRQAERQVRRADRSIDRLGRAITSRTITARTAPVRGPRAAELGARLRAVWSSSKRRVALGLTRMALWFRVRARARRGRRQRQVLAYLAQAQPQTQGERASAALLAVLTERIARAGASDASEGEITDAVAQAERIIASYDAQRAELEALLAVARRRTQRWIHWVGVADAKGSPELSARARSYLAAREGDEAELQRGVEDCDAGRRRLRDAIEQLRALAGRSGAR